MQYFRTGNKAASPELLMLVSADVRQAAIQGLSSGILLVAEQKP